MIKPTRQPSKRPATATYRAAVLAVIQHAECCLTGHEVATRTGLTYRQTVDALNALHNLARIQRVGRKFTARWCPLPDALAERPTALLERILWTIATKTRS